MERVHDVVQLRPPCPSVAPLILAVANDQKYQEYDDDGQGGYPCAEDGPVKLDCRVARLGDGLLGLHLWL